MKWFKKKPNEDHSLNTVLPPENQASIEIVAHKNAGKEAKQQVDEANQHLKELLEDNRFTLTMVLALGGKTKRKPNAR